MAAETEEKKEEMRIARIPVIGWLIGAIILLALLSWNLFRSMRVAQKRLLIEKQIRDLRLSYQRSRAKFENKRAAEIAAINKRSALKMTMLQARKKKNVEESRTLEGTAALANRVFGKHQ